MGDAEAALAFVALRQARRALPVQDWVHVLSLDLGWMSPAQARRLVLRCSDAGLLRQQEGDTEMLEFALDPAKVVVPPFFRPHPEAVPDPLLHSASPPAEEGFLAWLEAYTRHAGCERAEALHRISKRQAEAHGLLTADAALLWVAAEAGLDVRTAAARLIGQAGRAAEAPR
ncbi:MAG: DUF2240 family protein [Halobacteriales archaeon]|nr:DUF2240 family protein [Halobacteriales archaeon]